MAIPSSTSTPISNGWEDLGAGQSSCSSQKTAPSSSESAPIYPKGDSFTTNNEPPSNTEKPAKPFYRIMADYASTCFGLENRAAFFLNSAERAATATNALLGTVGGGLIAAKGAIGAKVLAAKTFVAASPAGTYLSAKATLLAQSKLGVWVGAKGAAFAGTKVGGTIVLWGGKILSVKVLGATAGLSGAAYLGYSYLYTEDAPKIAEQIEAPRDPEIFMGKTMKELTDQMLFLSATALLTFLSLKVASKVKKQVVPYFWPDQAKVVENKV